MSAGYAQTTAAASVALSVNSSTQVAESQRAPSPSWFALTAPGMLLTRSIVMLTLIVAPWVTALVYVAPVVRVTTAALLLLHLVSTRFIVRNSQRPSMRLAFCGLLAIDALLSGVLLGTDPRLGGPAAPLSAVVLAMSFGAAGWFALLLCALATLVTAVTTAWCAVAGPLLLSMTLSFAPTLSLETFVAGAPASTALGVPTALSVETVFAGVPAIDRGATLFVPALAIALIALCVGSGASLLRVRRTLSAVASTVVVDEQVTI